MRKIHIHFCDFWTGFNIKANYFTELLKNEFELIFDNLAPELLIYSCYGYENRKYPNALRIEFIAENIRPNLKLNDFSLSFDRIQNKKHYRLPLWILYGNLNDLIISSTCGESFFNERKFCNTLVSNPKGKERNHFFELLNTYKKVDSGGRYKNNIGGIPVVDRFEFIKNYKFTIAFENSSHPGYCTEKLVQPIKANSIPIYWGDATVHKDFNPDAFINVHDFNNLNEVVEYVKYLDNDKEAYLKKLNAPLFYNNSIPKHYTNEFIQSLLIKVLNKGKDTNTLKELNIILYGAINQLIKNSKNIKIKLFHRLDKLWD
ncbi:glycosyltransferase family 10 domain-containing protein [Saccharicrinis sp. 156]|uniref:glycosyltransferase family 10 domain-containing protein n=1 Tax=Saccharicrinis sp. 156 TaxID=3417574 RepID=UPI003D347F7B